MYSEIASNKRRSVIFIVLFFVIWLAIGAAYGFLFKAVYHPSVNTGYAAAPPSNYGSALARAWVTASKVPFSWAA